jgi:membrane fusion protein (multidrug efflux system)
MRERLGGKRTLIALLGAAAVIVTIVSLYVLRSAAARPTPATAATSPSAAATPAPAADDKTGKSPKDASAKPPTPVSVENAAVGSVSSYITTTANLIPENEVKVLAEADGRVTTLTVEEGDCVKRAQLLATLDRRDAEIAYEKAKLREANTRQAYERAVQLTKENLVTEQDFDRTTTDFRLAEQELAEAKWRLDKTEIRAPFDGRVTQRNITVGQHVAPGAELFQVTAFEPLIARIYLPEQDVMDLKEGREVRITLKADEGVRFVGRIRQIAPTVDPSTGTVKVTVEAVRPPDVVRPGSFVTIEIVRATHDNAVLVPRRSIIREMQTAHLFVVKDDVAERRDVILGIADGAVEEVLAGVTAGEQVVVAGQGNLRNGAAVTLITAESDDRPATTVAAL